MDELNDFIHVYEKAIEPNICEFLISLFDQVKDKYEEIDNDGKQKFTQFNLTENCKLNEEVNNVHNYLIHKTFEYKYRYIFFLN